MKKTSKKIKTEVTKNIKDKLQNLIKDLPLPAEEGTTPKKSSKKTTSKSKKISKLVDFKKNDWVLLKAVQRYNTEWWISGIHDFYHEQVTKYSGKNYIYIAGKILSSSKESYRVKIAPFNSWSSNSKKQYTINGREFDACHFINETTVSLPKMHEYSSRKINYNDKMLDLTNLPACSYCNWYCGQLCRSLVKPLALQ